MRTSNPRKNGFTLLEVLIVIVIIGLAIGIVVSRGPARSVALEARSAAADLARAFRQARGQAILLGRPVPVVVDFQRRIFVVDGAAHPWPAGVVLSPAVAHVRAETLRFDPDGAGSGGRVDVTDGQTGLTVAVDWLTGRVTVGPRTVPDAG